MNTSRPSFLSHIPPATLNIIIINVLCWIASLIFPMKFSFNVVQHFGLHYFESSAFNPIQLISYMFLHDTSSITHLFFNMFGVYMFGVVLEQMWGWKKYLLFYFVCGIGAAVAQQIVWAIELVPLTNAFDTAINLGSYQALESYEPLLSRYVKTSVLSRLSPEMLEEAKGVILNMPLTIGASGALFGILFAFGWMFPDVKMFLLFIPIPIKARIFVILYALIELFLGVSNFSGDNVAHFAHLGGALIAVLMVLIWRKRGRLYSKKL